MSGGHEQRRFTYTTQRFLHATVPREVTHASVHETVQELRRRAFLNCHDLLEVNLNMGLLAIGDEVFKNCRSLKKISVPLTVRRIGYSAFLGCGLLTDVDLNEGLQEIDGLAFLNCRSLQRISIPSTVETIGESAFEYCQSLTEVNLQDGLLVIGKSAFGYCIALTHMHMPSTVHTIGESAFEFCQALVDVELNDGLVSIKANLFHGCTSLCAISIPYTVNAIEKWAFRGCEKLVGVEFSSSGQNKKMELGSEVFRSCSSLVNVSIPSTTTVDGIPEDLFRECPLLELPAEMLTAAEDDDNDQDPLQDRYANLPIHEVCYQVSRTTVDDLKARLKTVASSSSNDAKKDCLVDAFGMTPLHILATSSILRTDLLEVLLDHYSDHLLEIVSQKDCHKKTMMDYLLAHGSFNQALPMIQMALQYTVVDTIMSGWGLERWRTDMALHLESMQWTDSEAQRRQSVTQVLAKKLAPWIQVEVTSILELVLWKMQIDDSTMQDDDDPSPPPTTTMVDRQSCRMICKADDVISNVVGFLWGDESSSSSSVLPSNVLPKAYHIISMQGI